MINCPHCLFCRHYMMEEESNKCEAYPEGIPDSVFAESVFFKEGHECLGDNFYEYRANAKVT